MPTYKTKDGIDRIIPGIGRTINGQITTDAKIENPMFEIVSEGEAPAPAAQAATAAPAAPAAAPTTGVTTPAPAKTTPATLEQIAAGAGQTQTKNEEQA